MLFVFAAIAEAKNKVRNQQREPVYAFRPVLTENKGLWQFLHSLLMLLSFCFLLPIGSLLARHKWIFGRDDLSVSAAGRLQLQQPLQHVLLNSHHCQLHSSIPCKVDVKPPAKPHRQSACLCGTCCMYSRSVLLPALLSQASGHHCITAVQALSTVSSHMQVSFMGNRRLLRCTCWVGLLPVSLRAACGK